MSDTGAPLLGRSVVVTRTREQSAALAGPLELLGATVIACPVIEIIDPADWAAVDAAVVRLAEGGYDWVVLTSTNAVERFLGRVECLGLTLDILRGVRIAVVGSATARCLENHGASPELVPQDFRAEGLVDEFVARGVGPGVSVLIPRAQKAREILPEALRDLGVGVDVVPVYRTVAATPGPEVLARLESASFDAVTFTSPSTVKHFFRMLGSAGLEPVEALRGVVKASIGPVTTAALVALGSQADIEADPSTVEGLVDALTDRLG